MASESRKRKSPERESMPFGDDSGKPRILLAACGCVAAVQFGHICKCFSEWAEVKAVATDDALSFIDRATIPKDVVLYTDEDDWRSWGTTADGILHIQLRRWAEILVIAPVSANTLAKIAGGLCDNLLTCIVRAWDYSKPVFVAPSMNFFLWKSPFTDNVLLSLKELGIALITPASKSMADDGDHGNGTLADPVNIYGTVRLSYESRRRSGGSDG
ncbi:probable phosphopantothenoylcysteine decarboxylase [Syzygium oleosum]|uniref:probable phosphopantothenoylcysteine decarboxylase n=1 Tax=Syzygium oleosum TaxID=219896 RepID=UPI0024B8A028|nr:probable phosphopantothenoylcysteine decarboxylase [Syzygium oleosum]